MENGALGLQRMMENCRRQAKITSSLVALAAKVGNGLAAQADNEGFFMKVVN